MDETGCELPWELTLHASDEQAGIGNFMSPFELQPETHPDVLTPPVT